MAEVMQGDSWQMEVVPTGVPNLDRLLDGGLARGEFVLIVGGPGAGKTVLAEQMTFHWARTDRKVLWVVTPGESNEKLLTHLSRMRFFDSRLVGDALQIINLSRYLEQAREAQIDVIRQTVQRGDYGYVVIDGFQNIGDFLGSTRDIRLFLSELSSELSLMGITLIVTADTGPEQYWRSIEQTMADTILSLGRRTVEGRVQRLIHVLKQRGRHPIDGDHSFTIDDHGLHVHPRIETAPKAGDAPAPTVRLAFGLPGLDQLLKGGLLEGSSTLLVGGTGTGKSVLASQFVAEGIRQGQPGLYLAFFDSPNRMLQRADALGMPLRRGLEDGLLQIKVYPAGRCDPDACAEEAMAMIERLKVRRLVLDGLELIERELEPAGRAVDFVAALVEHLRGHGVTSILTYELPEIAGVTFSLGRPLFTQATGNLILLRFSRADTRRQRLLSVLKTRYSDHSAAVAELLLSEGRVEVITDPAAVKQEEPGLVPVAFRGEPQAGHYH